MDVYYLTNAEGVYPCVSIVDLLQHLAVERFNGCGYCKVRIDSFVSPICSPGATVVGQL